MNGKSDYMEREEKNFRFYSPTNTTQILFQSIKKIGKYKYNERKRREEKIDYRYQATESINPSLIFSKLIPYALGDDERENKHKYLEFVINQFDKLSQSEFKIVNVIQRIEKTLCQLQNMGYQIIKLDNLKLSFRMVIGLGGTHPQETSMTLHHIYGIPYIPGSAIKGVSRHWAIINFAEKYAQERNENDFDRAIDIVERALENGDESLSLKITINNVEVSFSDVIQIFGTQKEQGKLIFFDAYPVENLKLKIDIMNPHYPEYYSGSQPPADWQNPKPIKFLTIDEKTNFNFNLASKDDNLLKTAKLLLEDALKNFGIGAKTSLGYGVFEELN